MKQRSRLKIEREEKQTKLQQSHCRKYIKWFKGKREGEGERIGRMNRKGRAGKGVGTQWLTSVVCLLVRRGKGREEDSQYVSEVTFLLGKGVVPQDEQLAHQLLAQDATTHQ